MADFAVRIGVPGRRGLTEFKKSDIKVLLQLHPRTKTTKALAERIGCSRENLIRLLGGREEYPILAENLARALEAMVKELPLSSKWNLRKVG